MAEYKGRLGNKAKVAVAALLLLGTQIACATTPVDPCDEAYKALLEAFTKARPSSIENETIHVWPSATDGSPTHPRTSSDQNWRVPAFYLLSNCGEKYEVRSNSLIPDERYFDDGVDIRKKLVPASQHQILPEFNLGVFLTGGVVLLGGLLGVTALFVRSRLSSA